MKANLNIDRRNFLKATLAGAGAAALCPSALMAAKTAKKKPNIILIMADDISAKDFPTYNIPNPTYGDAPCSTPVLEEIKNKGVQFKHGWATPLCHPSRGMVLTGKYAHQTGWWSNSFTPHEGEENYPLGDHHITIGKIAKMAGYTNQFVGKWQLAGTMETYCFDEYVFTPGRYAARSPKDKKASSKTGKGKSSYYWNPGYSLHNHPDIEESQGEQSKHFKTTWKDFAPDIEIKYIKDFMQRKQKSGDPFMVYWPAHLGHSNWDYVNDRMGYPGVTPMDTKKYPGTKNVKVKMPDGTVVERSESGINYHVQYLDKLIGDLIEHTKKLGIDKETVIIFTTDNASTSYGKGLKGAVKEHGPKVPFIIYGPGYVKARGEVDDFASLADVAPTLASLTGAKVPSDCNFDGIDMVDYLSGKTDKHRDWVYSYNAEYKMVRTRNLLRDGLDMYWDTRGTLDQESYKLISKDAVPKELKDELKVIESVLNKYPSAPTTGPEYERYMKSKAGKRKLWEKMQQRIFKENGLSMK